MASDVTPPGSYSGTLLTPPPTEERARPIIAPALRILRQHQLGELPDSPWVEYKFSPNDYVNFTRLLESDPSLCKYVDDKIR